METPREGLKIHGFSRVQIEQDGKIVGDSGFVGPNQIVNLGFLDYLVKLIAASAGSKQITHIALGTGAAPASNGTTLPGEIMSSTQRGTVTVANVNSNTAQFTATFSSSAAFLTAAADLSNIGLFNTSAEGTLFAGNTYASSSCDTNQNVNVTYQIRFS